MSIADECYGAASIPAFSRPQYAVAFSMAVDRTADCGTNPGSLAIDAILCGKCSQPGTLACFRDWRMASEDHAGWTVGRPFDGLITAQFLDEFVSNIHSVAYRDGLLKNHIQMLRLGNLNNRFIGLLENC